MNFTKEEIDFSVVQSLPPLVSDYLKKDEKLNPFYNHFPDEDGFAAAINERSSLPVHRKILSAVLAKQNEKANPKTKDNIALLKDDNTFTITTGHQLNLFTGPMYFIYKILSVVKLTLWLKERFPKNHFVPVYWMASEDHDIEEINHTFVFGKKIEWKSEESGAAGRISNSKIESAIQDLQSILGQTSEALIARLRKAYLEKSNLAEATRSIVDDLFGKYGLVVLNPDDAELKRLFLPAMKKDLLSSTSYKETADTISALEKLNYSAQVNPREVNLFYMESNRRERITKEGNRFTVVNSTKSWSETELFSEMDKSPECFSPNVVLRPVYQETVLPNLAYIGGPAEIAYWFEYKKMFDRFNVFFPVLILRNCAMISDLTSVEKMKRLSLHAEDLFKSYDQLAKEFVLRNDREVSFESEIKQILSAYQTLQSKVSEIDQTLSKTVEGEKQKQLNALQSLEEKIVRAKKKKHETSLQQIQKLKERFFQGGTLQERQENFLGFYLKYGDTFFDSLLNLFEPVATRFHFISEKEG